MDSTFEQIGKRLQIAHTAFIIGKIHENPSLYLRVICLAICEPTGVIVSGSDISCLAYPWFIHKLEHAESESPEGLLELCGLMSFLILSGT